MQRFLMIVALLGAFAVGATGMAGGVAGVAAQDATPDAAQTGRDPAIGDPVAYVNEQGDEVAQLTVEEIIDPFDEYEEGYDPERGTRYVAVRVTIEATGEDPVPIAAFDISLLDSQGFWLGSTAVTRTAEQEADDPIIEDTEVAAGDSVTGLLFYVVFEENDVDQVFWQPAGDRLITLADVA
jgi:hypothetical protein